MGRAKCLTGLAKFSAWQQQLKDAARLGRPATTTTKGDIEKTEISSKLMLNSCKTIGSNDKLAVSKSSCNFEETPKSHFGKRQIFKQ